MSARNDYRWLARVENSVDGGSDAARDVGAALDEIDELRISMGRAEVMRLRREIDELRAEVAQWRRLSNLKALRRTITDPGPALKRLTRPAEPS